MQSEQRQREQAEMWQQVLASRSALVQPEQKMAVALQPDVPVE